jgi:hypothetical protein
MTRVTESLPAVEEAKSDSTEDTYAVRMRRLAGILSGRPVRRNRCTVTI